jgi:hypothetical protein
MLLFCEVGDDYKFFELFWKLLADDVQYNMRKNLNHQEYLMLDCNLQNEVLRNLNMLFDKQGRSIKEFNLPKYFEHSSQESINRLFDEELNYDANTLTNESQIMIGQLNHEQRHAFNMIVETVLQSKPGFFFVPGYGGTGKTFLWNMIITYLRGHRKIVLSVASLGVASLLLPGGSHSALSFQDSL